MCRLHDCSALGIAGRLNVEQQTAGRRRSILSLFERLDWPERVISERSFCRVEMACDHDVLDRAGGVVRRFCPLEKRQR